MKKILCIIIALVFVTLPGTVLANYESKVSGEIRQEMGAFYQRNEGSRITIDLMDGLMLHLNQIFDGNRIVPERPKDVMKAAPSTPEKPLTPNQ